MQILYYCVVENVCHFVSMIKIQNYKISSLYALCSFGFVQYRNFIGQYFSFWIILTFWQHSSSVSAADQSHHG